MKRILLAEDNPDLRENVSDYLQAHDFRVTGAADGLEAQAILRTQQFDLILLDVMMPGMDGFSLCRWIREREDTPILFLTARVQEKDQLRGYSLGADDYITKPFSLAVLTAKCQAILARKSGTSQGGEWLTSGEIRVNPILRQAFLGEQDMILTARELELLTYFLRNPNRPLSREQILDRVWGCDYEGNDRAVDTHVKNLRKRLGTEGRRIRTVMRVGYCFRTENQGG